jgi:purine nucleoside phosphorylase
VQIIYTPGGDVVAVMKAKEAVLAEAALMRYVAESPDSNLAVRMLRDVANANEQAEQRAEEAAEAAAVNSI